MSRSRQALKTAALALLLAVGAGRILGQAQTSPSVKGGASTAAQSVFIRVLPYRMEPAMITVKPGPLLIIVQNRSTAPNITLQLDQANGTRLKSVRMVSGQRHSQETYDLAAGEYLLSEAKHPAWKCKITVK